MTTLTNNYGLPSAIVKALQHDDYSRGDSDISVSQLVSPPRAVALQERHRDQIVRDASDMLFILQGKLMHKLLQEAGVDALTEERLFIVACPVHGLTRITSGRCCEGAWVVSGQFDNLGLEADNGWKLTDWKNTSVYTLRDGVKPEWEAQTNLYALLLMDAGFDITSLYIGALYRDWSKPKAASGEHPPVGAAEFPVNLWSADETERYLIERVVLHHQARLELPECTDEERWAKAPKYAVMKEGVQRAQRLLDTDRQALEWAFANKLAVAAEGVVMLKPGISIVHRLGEQTHCLHYCDVGKNGLCEQWNAMAADA